jgi:uncharacterized damage-inducible protein DinB
MALIKHTLQPVAHLPTGLSLALAAMNEVRGQLQRAVSELTDEQVARRALEGVHSIGALTLHIGEAEWWWMNCIVQGHKLTREDFRQPFWDVLKEPDAFASKKHSAAYCLDVIDGIRGQTHDFLATLSDDDLEKTYSHKRGNKQMEASLRWILHHLVDHEAQHKGQILMLKRLLGEKNEDVI